MLMTKERRFDYMSRKWERMVEKNQKKIGDQRKKRGLSNIKSSDGSLKIKGRSWIFPGVLALVGIFFALTGSTGSMSSLLYQITIGLYLLLALYHFFVRRPHLTISKNQLSWRTYTGEKIAQASDIMSISISHREAIIALKDLKTRKSFSKFVHLYPMNELNEALQSFATANRVQLVSQLKE